MPLTPTSLPGRRPRGRPGDGGERPAAARSAEDDRARPVEQHPPLAVSAARSRQRQHPATRPTVASLRGSWVLSMRMTSCSMIGPSTGSGVTWWAVAGRARARPSGRRNGVDRPDGVALGAGDLYQPADEIAVGAEVALDADPRAVPRLLRRPAEDLREAGRGRRAGRAHLPLAADLGSGGGGVPLEQHADGPPRRTGPCGLVLSGARPPGIRRQKGWSPVAGVRTPVRCSA